MNTRKLIAAVLLTLMGLLFPGPYAQKRVKRDPGQIPGKDNPSTAERRMSAKAEFCLSSIKGTGPMATVDPDGDGCLMQQEYTFVIKNTGIVTAPSSVVQLIISNSQNKEKRVVNRRISDLKPGQIVSVTFKFSIVADSYKLRLDAKGEVDELSEGNNEYLASCSGGTLGGNCK